MSPLLAEVKPVGWAQASGSCVAWAQELKFVSTGQGDQTSWRILPAQLLPDSCQVIEGFLLLLSLLR